MESRGVDRSIVHGRYRWFILTGSILYLAGLLSMASLGGSWGAYKGIAALWFLAYLGLVYLLALSDIPSALERLEPSQIMIGIFFVSLILHLPFLLQEPSMSQDILRLERRGELLMDGGFPYRDFDVNKPPLYIWMVGLISLPLGPEQFVFRIIFVMAGCFIPVLMFLIHRNLKAAKEHKETPEKGTGFNWFTASMAYVLCPIPLLEIGLGGHFDPVVVLATLASFYLVLKDRPFLSGVLLGAAFALKLYPLFIAPILFFTFGRWRHRWSFAGGFAAPTILSALPLLIVEPSLVLDYLRYQFYGWSPGISLRGALEAGLDQLGLHPDIAYLAVFLVLFTAVVHFSIRGLVGRPRRSELFPVVILMLLFAVLGSGLQSAYLSEYEAGLSVMVLGWLGTALAVVLSGLGLYVFLGSKPQTEDRGSPWNLKGLFRDNIDTGSAPILIACVLIVLMMTSAQFHAWYMIWALPFLFISKNSYFAWSALIIFSGYQINGYLPWDI